MFVNPGLQNTLALHFPLNPEFGFWQYITSMFMHSQTTIFHILFNMYALWAFGTPMEQIWGTKKFVFFYFSAGLGAGAIYTLANYYQYISIYDDLKNIGLTATDINTILTEGKYNTSILQHISEKKLSEFWGTFNSTAVGASGAVYGVLVAFGLYFPNAKLALIFFPVPISAKYFIPVLILLDLFMGVSGYNFGIANFAHLGGALFGFIMAYYWKKNQFNHNRWN